MAGARCWSRSSADTETGSCGATFVPMPPSPRQRCMSSWRLRARDPPSRQPGAATEHRHLLRHRLADKEVRRYHASFSYKHRAGASPVGWSPRSSGILPVSPCRVHVTNLSRPAETISAASSRKALERDQLEPAFLPWLPQQRGASSAARLGIQLGQLPAHRLARSGPLVADHLTPIKLERRSCATGYITFQIGSGAERPVRRLIDGLRPAPLPP